MSEKEQRQHTLAEVINNTYVKIFSGVAEKGVAYSLHEDILEFIWDAMPLEKLNMEYLTKKVDYILLSEIEMMSIDLLDQQFGGKYDHTSLDENWWFWYWLSDIIEELKSEEDFYLRKDDKSPENKKKWLLENISKETTQKSIQRAMERKEKWPNWD